MKGFGDLSLPRRLALLLPVVGLSAFALWYHRHGPLAPFDSAAWRAGESPTSDQPAPRLHLADGLLRSGILIGKTQAEVLALLGPPTDTDYFREYDLVYWLGIERGTFPANSDWLVLKFDSSGKVKSARIVSD